MVGIGRGLQPVEKSRTWRYCAEFWLAEGRKQGIAVLGGLGSSYGQSSALIPEIAVEAPSLEVRNRWILSMTKSHRYRV
jgi:hypothetical protein